MHFFALLILSVFCITHPNGVSSLVGFDCAGQHLNVTSVSLLGAGECNLKYETPNSTQVYVQLLQLSNYDQAEIHQCKIEILRTIYHCGMHSHVSIVTGGISEYLLEISQQKCLRLFSEGTMTIGAAGDIIDQIKANRTTMHSVTLAGMSRHDGTCKGTQYSDPYGTWDDVVVHGVVRITLKSGFVPVQLSSGKIILKSGTVCQLTDGFCLDSEDGYTFWKPMPASSCDFHQYDVLYEGPATRMSSYLRAGDETKQPVVYTLTSGDVTFALSKTTEQRLCGYTLLCTEHPKLFIVETARGETLKKRHGAIPVNNLDIFTYVNSKFVYVEKHVRNQMTSLYHNVMQQRCELERQVITNTLSFAALQPDEFAYRLMKGPGYMAVAAGEAIHVIKCIPVDVMVRKMEDACYNELPVSLRNNSLFLTPKSRILTKVGTRRECSFELPTLYRIEDTWVELTPQPRVRGTAPQELKPMTALTWRYLTPGPLAVSGIYTEKDLEKLRDHIMFPAEKPALLNTMARGVTGYSVKGDTVSMFNLMDEETLKRIADNTASRLWNGFITFGSATAGVMGIFIAIRIGKFCIDTLIHGYALHNAYGCTMHLVGAVWSSMTHLLLHLARGPKTMGTPTRTTSPRNNEDEDKEPREMDVFICDTKPSAPSPPPPQPPTARRRPPPPPPPPKPQAAVVPPPPSAVVTQPIKQQQTVLFYDLQGQLHQLEENNIMLDSNAGK